MKKLLLLSLLAISVNAYSQKFSYKIGLVTPIPFYVQTPYIADLSSVLGQIRYKLSDKFKATATTGYLRFRPNDPQYDVFSNVPVMIGATYDLSDMFYIGISTGPSYFNEDKVESIKILYSPYIGMQSNKWSIDLTYLNWEEVPDEANGLVLCISYNF